MTASKTRRRQLRIIAVVFALIGSVVQYSEPVSASENWWESADPVDTMVGYLRDVAYEERSITQIDVAHRNEMREQFRQTLEDETQLGEFKSVMEKSISEHPELGEFMNLAIGVEQGTIDQSTVREWLTKHQQDVQDALGGAEEKPQTSETDSPIDATNEQGDAAKRFNEEAQRSVERELNAHDERIEPSSGLPMVGDEGNQAPIVTEPSIDLGTSSLDSGGSAASERHSITGVPERTDVKASKLLDPCRPSVSSRDYPADAVPAPQRAANDAGAQMLSPTPGTMVNAWDQSVSSGSVQIVTDPITKAKSFLIRGHVQWQPNEWTENNPFNPNFGHQYTLQTAGDPAPQIWVRPLGQETWTIHRSAAEDPLDGSVRFSCYQDDAGSRAKSWLTPPGAFVDAGPSRGFAQLTIPVSAATRPGIEVRVVSRTLEYDATFDREPGTADPYDASLGYDASGNYLENRSARFLNWGNDNATMLVGAAPQDVNGWSADLVTSRAGMFIDDSAIIDTDGRPNDIQSFVRSQLDAAKGGLSNAVTSLSGTTLLNKFPWAKLNKTQMIRPPQMDLSLGKGPIHGGAQTTNSERALDLRADLGAYFARATYGVYFINCAMQTFVEARSNASSWLDINGMAGVHPSARINSFDLETWATFAGPIGPFYGPVAWATCGSLAVLIKVLTSNRVWNRLENGMLTQVNPLLQAALQKAAIPAPSGVLGAGVSFGSLWTNTCELWNGKNSASAANVPAACQGGDVALTENGIELGLLNLVTDQHPGGMNTRFDKLYRYSNPMTEHHVASHVDGRGVPASFGAVLDEALINSLLRAMVVGNSATNPNGLLDSTIPLGSGVTAKVSPTLAPIMAPLPGQPVDETAIIVPDLKIDLDFSGFSYNSNPISHLSFATTLIVRLGLSTSSTGEVRAKLLVDRPDLLLRDCPLADTGPTHIAWAQACNYLDFTVFDGTPLPSIAVTAPSLGINFSFNPNGEIDKLFGELNTTLAKPLSKPLFKVNANLGFGVLRNFRFTRKYNDLGVYADICSTSGPC